MIVTDSGIVIEQAPPGAHVARCIGLIDLGTNHYEYKGKPKTGRQAIFRWELPHEVKKEGDFAGEPFIVMRYFSLTLADKGHLRKALESWRGKPFTPDELKGFELKNVLGKPCMLQVVRDEKDRAKVESIMSVPKGLSVPERIGELQYFSFDDFKQADFDALPEWIRDQIEESDEWKELQEPGATAASSDADPFDDGIPF
jgi:hypothetical protein